jgi:hypothetical protein
MGVPHKGAGVLHITFGFWLQLNVLYAAALCSGRPRVIHEFSTIGSHTFRERTRFIAVLEGGTVEDHPYFHMIGLKTAVSPPVVL